ncbi:hypothetical protein P5W99_31535 [Paraburkholderia sp. A3BS-1L]|uniref:hypothetical protein n=1 Tax=Paraburkholderia sp. A3BS-1L TaxID=3028375 RepID=UPI003DA7BE9B
MEKLTTQRCCSSRELSLPSSRLVDVLINNTDRDIVAFDFSDCISRFKSNRGRHHGKT